MAINTPVERYAYGKVRRHGDRYTDFKGRKVNEVVQSLVLSSGFASAHRRYDIIMIPIASSTFHYAILSLLLIVVSY